VTPLDGEHNPQPIQTPSVRQCGYEPLPGYRLLEPLGRGGFGEVWKCEVPGGLFKAIKFVEGANTSLTGMVSAASQERQALESIKAIRHPFILSLERVEVVGGVLMIVLELADKNTQDLLLEHQLQGLPGIPRKQLLGLLSEAAEALDVMSIQHGLQHLDIKPHNLFVVANHVKVADFGLVQSLGGPEGVGKYRRAGLTPLYASPEVFQNSFSRHSDQYSLAIVFQQLLTGTVPFSSPDLNELRQLHLQGTPNLSPLPVLDRSHVTRALSKDPDKRFPSCHEFIKALSQRLTAELPSPSRLTAASSSSLPAPVSTDPSRLAGLSSQASRLLMRLKKDRQELERDLLRPGAPAAAEPEVTRPIPVQLFNLKEAGVPTVVRSDTPAPVASAPAAPPPAKVPAASAGQAPAPTWRFLSLRGQTPIGDLWTVEDNQGKQCLGYCLLTLDEASAEKLARVHSRGQSLLQEVGLFWTPEGRLVLVTELNRRTLRDHYEEWAAKGQPGIPRAELLKYLRRVAETLDQLQRQEGMSHLGLNPGVLLVQDDRVTIADFGLMALVGASTGQTPSQLNSRYAPLEAASSEPGSTCDSYSLALIYAEMLTGVYPRLTQPSSRSGPFRRINRSGGPPPGPVPIKAKHLDLDLLPATDRPILARALHDDPKKRFTSCVELVAALEAATFVSSQTDLYETLPLVIPFTSLLGKPPPPDTLMPQGGELVAQLFNTISGPSNVVVLENARYLVFPDGHWEYHFPIQMVTDLLRLKLEGFRQYWRADLIATGENALTLQIVTRTPPRSFWSFRNGGTAGIKIQIRLDPSPTSSPPPRPAVVDCSWSTPSGNTSSSTRQAIVQVLLFGDKEGSLSEMMRDMAPRLFQSIRAHLQTNPDQRGEQRFPFTQLLRIYPVLPDLQLAGVQEARARNLSRGGLSLVAPSELPSKYVYLHFHETPSMADLALLGRVVRCLPQEEGRFEVGLTFVVDGPDPA